MQSGLIDLVTFCRICRERGVPVIVDAAAEYGWRDFLAAGADLVLFSAQKAAAGLTAGVVAGKRDLVRACYAQQRGIGRPMKAGKEGIIGVVAALRRWQKLDLSALEAATDRRIERAMALLAGAPGLTLRREPDTAGNPFARLFIAVDPARARLTAYQLSAALRSGDPMITVRANFAERGILLVDLRRADDPTVDLIADRILAALAAAPERPAAASPSSPSERSATAFVDWLAEPDTGGRPSLAGAVAQRAS